MKSATTFALILIAGLIFNSCDNQLFNDSSKSTTKVFELGEEFTLHFGQVGLNKESNLRLEILKVEDYRCSKKSLCMPGGDGEVYVQFSQSGEDSEVKLSMGQHSGMSVEVSEFEIGIFALSPYPKRNFEEVPQKNYKAKLMVKTTE